MIDVYHSLVNGLGLAVSVVVLLSPRPRRRFAIIAAVTFAIVMGGELVVRAGRETEILRASRALLAELGTWGRPYDDLRREMSNFSPSIVMAALQRAEGSGAVERVDRKVHDLSSARDYTIDVFVPTPTPQQSPPPP